MGHDFEKMCMTGGSTVTVRRTDDDPELLARLLSARVPVNFRTLSDRLPVPSRRNSTFYSRVLRLFFAFFFYSSV